MSEEHLADPSLADLRRNWEGFGLSDPLWAVLSDPTREGGRWDVESFLATGEVEIETVMRRLASRGIAVSREGRALDFGCGPGRLTRALKARFIEVHGVDIASSMISAARRINHGFEGLHFHQQKSTDLALFESRSFSFVYSSIVLQHIPPPAGERYVASLLRLLGPGGVAVLQAPDRFEPGPIGGDFRAAASGAPRWVRSRVALRTRLAPLLPRTFRKPCDDIVPSAWRCTRSLKPA